MSKHSYHIRVSANMPYNPNLVYNQPTEYSLQRFTELLWHGLDDEGYCVFRGDPITREVIRIDFY